MVSTGAVNGPVQGGDHAPVDGPAWAPRRSSADLLMGRQQNKSKSTDRPAPYLPLLIPLFALSKCPSHPPTPSVTRAWWTSFTGKEADLEAATGSWWPPLAAGVRTRPCALGVHTGQTGMVSRGRHPFLSGPLSSPILHPIGSPSEV